MTIGKKLDQCKFNLKQIIHYNPDPYYVNHFFMEFIRNVIDIYDDILQEANWDFGLFIVGKCTLQKFEHRAREKNEQSALKFCSWFDENYKLVHKAPYPNFIDKIISFYKQTKHLPKIKIKIVADQRYKDDVSQEIFVGLTNGKIRSKEELEIEIKRQSEIFLEVINHKRKIQDEPKVSVSQIMGSAFIEMGNSIDFEILDVCNVYLLVLDRFIEESRNKIKKLTQWEGG